MSDAEDIISIKILDHNYSIKCPAGQASQLAEAARHLDEQMRKIRQSGSIKNIDGIAVVAALNISNELQQLKQQKSCHMHSTNHYIQNLRTKIQNFLASTEEITV